MENVNPQHVRMPGYPKIIDYSKRKEPFKHDSKDPNFDRPIAELERNYSESPKPSGGIVFFKIIHNN